MSQPAPDHLIALPVHRATLDKLDDELRRYATRAGVDDQTQKRLRLILEELVTNSLHYGQCAGAAIEIRLRQEPDGIHIEYRDPGIAFDPTREAPEDGVDLPLDARRVGGLGWTLIRSLCREIRYQREAHANHLRMLLPSGS